MNLVDSSGWLEYFTEGPNSSFFSPSIEDPKNLLVSSINVFEVFKKILRERGEDDALQAIAVMRQGKVVDIDFSLSLAAAALSIEHSLPMADSIIFATARGMNATVWTQDADFRGLEGVQFIEKK